MSLGAMRKDGSGLTDKQLLFCEEYLANKMNGSKAAVAAGYSEKGAAAQSTRLLNDANVREYFEQKLHNLTKSTKTLAVRVVKEYIKIAFSQPSDIIRTADKIAALDRLSKLMHLVDDTQRVEISGPNQSPINLDVKQLSDKELKQLNDVLEKLNTLSPVE